MVIKNLNEFQFEFFRDSFGYFSIKKFDIFRIEQMSQLVTPSVPLKVSNDFISTLVSFLEEYGTEISHPNLIVRDFIKFDFMNSFVVFDDVLEFLFHQLGFIWLHKQ